VRLKLKATLEGFQAPWLQMYVSTLGMLKPPAQQSSQTPEQRKQILELLRLLCRIFFSLSCVDIPEFFEDNLATILNGHAVLMVSEQGLCVCGSP
jgi:exportin-2 (importin alpha re-exporter)